MPLLTLNYLLYSPTDAANLETYPFIHLTIKFDMLKY